MKVEAIMSRDPLYVEVGTFVTKARQLIRDNHVRGLPVLDTNGRVTGIVTNQDMLRITSTRSNVTVDGFTVKVPTITPETEVNVAARTLLHTKAALLPVVKSQDDSTMKGVLTLLDVFKNLDLGRVPDETVGKFMSTKVVTASPSDPLTKVWDMMLEGDFTGLPVVDDGKPIGMITRFDIIKRGWARLGKEDPSRSKNTTGLLVEKLMSTPIYTLEPQDRLKKAIELMLKLDVGRISVISDQKLVGIVDRYDIIKAVLKES